MELSDRLPRLVRRLGGDLYGVADLTPAKETMMEQGGLRLEEWPRAVSIGVALPHAVIDQLPRGRETRALATTYQLECYDVINRRLDDIASRVASALQREGFRALPVPSRERISDERRCALFSHKLAAHLAGLGWIGRSCLLVTPEHGPRVRWVTVLTTAPLPCGEPMEQRCGECRQCVDACPVGAFTGRAFLEAEPREARYDAAACERYLQELGERNERAVCGMCLYMCPHGRSASKRLR